MDHSLKNTNKIRAIGILMQHGPFNENKGFRIDHDELFIFLETDGSAVYFVTHMPCDKEFETCEHFV